MCHFSMRCISVDIIKFFWKSTFLQKLRTARNTAKNPKLGLVSGLAVEMPSFFSLHCRYSTNNGVRFCKVL